MRIEAGIRAALCTAMIFGAVACAAESVDDDAALPVPAPGKGDSQTAGLPMISEYVEGSFGTNKIVELFNPLPFAVSMDACSVEVYSNGRTTPRRISLEGVVLEPDGTGLVCSISPDLVSSCDVESGNLSFNGNDAVALACDFGSGPHRLDVIGVVGEDPGSGGWSVDGESTRNMTLRRRCTTPAGDDEFTPEQWVAAGVDVVDDLGQHELCDAEPEPGPTCSQGDDVLGASADILFGGTDPRFSVEIEETLFDNFTPRTQALLLDAASQFLLDADELTDAASALAGVAREGSGTVERFVIHDNDSGIDYDAVRYFANDATSHSVVYPVGSDERAAFSFDGEFFSCDGVFCQGGELSRVFYEGIDENFEPDNRFEIVSQDTVLAVFGRRNRVLRSDTSPTLLTVAFEAHGGAALISSEVLEELARVNAGPITYVFVAGPTEDLEGVTFHTAGGDRGMLVVEDSHDVELLTSDAEVSFCAQ